MTAALRIGTRASTLALWQAHQVAAALERQGRSSEIVAITTAGDRLADRALAAAGGKRLFVKEIEDALIGGAIDVAVHSAKDLPVDLPAGLAVGATLPRDDPRDALVLPAGAAATSTSAAAESDFTATLSRLPDAARVGTSSVRRAAQLARVVPHAVFAPIRGNVETRLRKLDTGGYDVIVLAAAGLIRLGLQSRITTVVPPDVSVPAPGQGIVAIEVRETDTDTLALVAAIDDADAGAALEAERALVIALGGGCQLPVGALAELSADEITLTAVVVSLDGRDLVRVRSRAARREAAALGRSAGARLIAAGADRILDEVRRQTPS